MRFGWVAGVVGIGSLVAIARPDAISMIIDQIYPGDPMLRRALNECFTQDPNFNRIDTAAREACYRHSMIVNRAEPAGVPGAGRSARSDNFVDLWRAAGQGHLPQNDIRAQQREIR